MTKTLDMLFEDFINDKPTGELAAAMHRISGDVDAAIEAGDMDKAIELTADHELAATQYGFYAGFMAALKYMGMTAETRAA